MREVELVGHWCRPPDGFILSLSVKVAFMNYASCGFLPSRKGCWVFCCGEYRPAAPQEEQAELLCLRHEVCLEMLGTEGEHASSSSYLSPDIPHWPFCLGGMGWLCCGLGLVACQHSVGHPALSAKPWLHMSGDFCACFPRGTKSCLDHPQLSEVWCQFDCRSCCKAGQCSKISLWLISLRRLLGAPVHS